MICEPQRWLGVDSQNPSFAKAAPIPRRSILSAIERDSPLTLPNTKYELIWHYSFNESDLALIHQRCGPANRLGFAAQLCMPWKPYVYCLARHTILRCPYLLACRRLDADLVTVIPKSRHLPDSARWRGVDVASGVRFPDRGRTPSGGRKVRRRQPASDPKDQ